MLSSTERVAILTAMQKAVKEALNDARDELGDSMRTSDVERLALKVGGEKVGTAIIAGRKTVPMIDNQDEFMEFALDYGFATSHKEINPALVPSLIRYLEINPPEDMQDVIIERYELDNKWEEHIECRGEKCYLAGTDLEAPGVVPCTTLGTLQVRDCKPVDVIPRLDNISIRAALGGGTDE